MGRGAPEPSELEAFRLTLGSLDTWQLHVVDHLVNARAEAVPQFSDCATVMQHAIRSGDLSAFRSAQAAADRARKRYVECKLAIETMLEAFRYHPRPRL